MGVVNSSLQGDRTGSPRDNNNKEIALDRNTLEGYLELEREIAEEEHKNPIHPLELKKEQLARLSREVKEKQDILQNVEAETAKELQDVTLLKRTSKSAILEMGAKFDAQMSKESAEHLAAVNKQEIAEQELEAIERQREQVQVEVSKMEKDAQKLQELHKKQDSLLDKMFGGAYGSQLENKLEGELDTLDAHRGRILEANFKWRQAAMMLEYACKQLQTAVQKWQDLPTLPTIDLEIRYTVAAETRNNLVAAGQNLAGAQRYLENVEFPYCDVQEVNTLNKATEYVFTDMQSADRHSHAHMCYSTTHKRALALLQWFDTVINTTITKDLDDINKRVKEKGQELRQERVRLIKAKLIEMWGSDVDFGDTLRDPEVDVNVIARAMLQSANKTKENGKKKPSSDAPMPSTNEIFGPMYDNMKEQLDSHQQDMQKFIMVQQDSNSKVHHSLEEKLTARRQRRALKNVENAQRNALTTPA